MKKILALLGVATLALCCTGLARAAQTPKPQTATAETPDAQATAKHRSAAPHRKTAQAKPTPAKAHRAKSSHHAAHPAAARKAHKTAGTPARAHRARHQPAQQDKAATQTP